MATRPYPHERGFTLQHHIDALREELRAARHAVLLILPYEWSSILLPRRDVSRDDSKYWMPNLPGVIADKVQYDEQYSRAVCPLCGAGTSVRVYGTASYIYGYTKVGMMRHLEHRGGGYSCPVMRVVADLHRVDHKAKWSGDYGPYSFD